MSHRRPVRCCAAAALGLTAAALAAGVAVPAAETAKEEPPSKIDVRPDARFADLKAEIEKHKGKVVLVDFWATWCDPCVAMFPHLIALHTRHFGDGLRTVTVTLDEAEELDKVKKFLTRHKAYVPTLVYSDYAAEHKKVRDAWFPEAKDYSGGVPVTLVIGRDGKVAAAFVTRDNLPLKKLAEEIDAAVDKALKAK
jgi:thiol-disulfide isomerase/thioredoxin